MELNFAAIWAQSSFIGRGVFVLMGIMSVYSLWVIVERFIVFSQAKNQSLKLIGSLLNILTRSAYQEAMLRSESAPGSPPPRSNSQL